VLDDSATITWGGVAEFPYLIFIIDGNAGCDGLTILASATADPGFEVEIIATVNAGTYWTWAGPSVFADIPCGSGYWAELDCGGGGCELECPPGSTPEGEPTCFENYEDLFNGGCNSAVPVFSPISINETVCGESGTYLFDGNNYRDTDWYEIDFASAQTVTWGGQAEFPFLVFIIDGTAGCGGLVILNSGTAGPCEELVIEASVSAGVHWTWAGPSVFAGVDCGALYFATLGGESTCAGDVDGDGDTDVDDLLLLLAAWGTADPDADLDGSGLVDVDDLLLLLADWGCPG
jgi:hypothetical protein